MKILLGGLLALSLTLNLFLWKRRASQGFELKSAQASAREVDELRRQNRELEIDRVSTSDSAIPDMRELQRLRGEVSQLRKQAGEVEALRAQAAEAVRLRARLANASQELARAESKMAEALKLSPEELQQVKGEAQSIQCVNSLKQIGEAAWQWNKDHGNVFPPDFISMKDQLQTPKVLFCPADAAANRVTEWSQLDASSISYRMNPNGLSDPNMPVVTCSIHGHTLQTDGSVHRK